MKVYKGKTTINSSVNNYLIQFKLSLPPSRVLENKKIVFVLIANRPLVPNIVMVYIAKK